MDDLEQAIDRMERFLEQFEQHGLIDCTSGFSVSDASTILAELRLQMLGQRDTSV